MKAKKYTEEQIIAVLKEGAAGAKVADLCRKYGMSDAWSEPLRLDNEG
jgi:putative transposase